MTYILISVILIYYTNVHYHAVMNLKRNKAALSKPAWVFNFPVLLIGLIFDFLLTIIVGTVVFFDLPRELTLTARLQRYKDRADFRGRLGRWICRHLLDGFDPAGKHC